MTRERKLLTPERESLIIEYLGENGRTIAELSEDLGVSEATVRRDLKSLEEQGKIRRVHGGAIRVKFPKTEPIFTQKTELNAFQKRNIAQLALNMIEDSDTIFLDGGSTVLGLCKLLNSKKDLTVVTNSLMAAAELMETNHKLVLVGGEFRRLSRTLVGPLTSKIINSLHITKAFMGTIGFTISEGISTTDPSEAFTKELVMKRSQKVILLADSSKLEIPSFASSGSISDIDILITDSGIDEKLIKTLKKKNIQVIY